ncbi:MAG: DMT family transporter [Pararhodobacter sp.]|nr:DMT family transporter [Pararhodobacter sp.]
MIAVRSTATIGALCALGAAMGFTMNDMAIKYLSEDYAMHQVVSIRSAIALGLMLFVVMPLTGGFSQIRTRRPFTHLLRGLFVVGANMAFFLALAAMPMADATAIFFVSPLIIAVFSVIFLKETVGPRRWAAIGIGLLGVLIMIRPGTASFTLVALLPLVAAAAYAALHTLTRKLGVTESAATLAFYIQLTFIVFSGAVGLAIGDGRFDTGGHASMAFLTRAWTWPALADWPFFLITGLGSAIGGLLISQAYRLCEAALVAPLEYVAMPMAIIWGVFVFGDWPDTWAWAGIVLIIGSGIYMIWRETRNRVK